jgi:cation diffusion facilitator CzcD-associated flavoprotein CzcO
MIISSIDVAIVGAGPYGISLAAYLRKRQVEHRVFGAPMQFWRTMSPGMYLKSFAFATNIRAPEPHYGFKEYLRAQGVTVEEPVEIATFGEYGAWAQRQIAPHVENVQVMHIAHKNGVYALTLETGEQVWARRVVIATGLTHYERMPEALAGLEPELVSHSVQHGDFSKFRGMKVGVLGAGQSALQAAALLHENGAHPTLIIRGADVWWSEQMPDHRSLKQRLKYPMSVLGPGRLNWVLQHAPMAPYRLPAMRRVRLVRRHGGPLGAWWLRPRVEGIVPVENRCTVVGAQPRRDGLAIQVNETELGQREITVDHLIAGTGFAVDVDRLPFLDRALAAEVFRIERAPILSPYFESSARGLYFVGPSSTMSFGPLFRFVAGADFAIPRLARRLTGNRPGQSEKWALEAQEVTPALAQAEARVPSI